MKIARALIAIVVALALSLAPAAAQMTLTGAGPGSMKVASVSYTGPGDLLTFTGWWGLRAYSTADRGSALINVCNAGDANCVDMSSDASTGALNVVLVGATDCSVSTCTIKIWYDRSGGAHDMTVPGINTRATLIVSCINSRPCARFNGTTASYSATGTTLSQPFTMSFVAKRPSSSTAMTILGVGTNLLFGYGSAVNAMLMYAGSALATATASDGTFHRIQGVFNGASSVGQVDTAAPATLSPGTSGTGSPITIATDGFGDFFNGDFSEAGYSNTSAANATWDLNAKAWYGL